MIAARRFLRIPATAAAILVTVVAGLAVRSSPAAASGTSAFYAWGYNYSGQVGTGRVSEWEPSPVLLARFGGAVVQAVGSGRVSMVLLTDGTVWAWGNNDEGELGNGTTAASLVPVRVGSPPPIVTVPGLIDDTCAQAISELQSVGLDGSCNGTGQFVGQQSPGEGTRVPRGTVVSLTMTVNPP